MSTWYFSLYAALMAFELRTLMVELMIYPGSMPECVMAGTAAGEVMNRDQIMNRIRNREWFPDDRYIDVLVGQLRKKLGERAATAKIITTIHGTGYLFTPEVV